MLDGLSEARETLVLEVDREAIALDLRDEEADIAWKVFGEFGVAEEPGFETLAECAEPVLAGDKLFDVGAGVADHVELGIEGCADGLDG